MTIKLLSSQIVKGMMNETKNILDDNRLKEDPFRMPDGYLESLEASLNEKIEQGETGGRWFEFKKVFKPAITLAAMFLLIFGMGYGALSLTGTLHEKSVNAGSNFTSAGYELFEGGFLNSSFIDFYSEDMEAFEERNLEDDDIFDFLSSELSYEDLSELLCNYDKSTIETY